MADALEITRDLSDRLLILCNTFRKAKEGYIEFDPQSAKTFLALLHESYEDALLLEGAAAIREQRATAIDGTVVTFPRAHVRPHLISGDAEDGDRS